MKSAKGIMTVPTTRVAHESEVEPMPKSATPREKMSTAALTHWMKVLSFAKNVLGSTLMAVDGRIFLDRSMLATDVKRFENRVARGCFGLERVGI